MDDDLHALGEDLISDRGAPGALGSEGGRSSIISLVRCPALGSLSRRRANPDQRPRGGRTMLAADDHQPRQAARGGSAWSSVRSTRGRQSVDDQAHQAGQQQLELMRVFASAPAWSPTSRRCPSATSRHCVTASTPCDASWPPEGDVSARETAGRAGRAVQRVPPLRHRHAIGARLSSRSYPAGCRSTTADLPSSRAAPGPHPQGSGFRRAAALADLVAATR